MSSSAGLDPRFFLCFPLQEYFVDKDSGLPLSGGIVTFYDQNSQSVLKPVYTLSGNGPFSTASYIQLPNPLILSSVGTFIDNNGNDIIPYLFPYDGTPASSTGTVDLYYITVYNSAGVLQFTRQAWPNLTSSTAPSSTEFVNYIPNGQLLLHNSIPAWVTNNYIANQLPAPTTYNNANAVPASADVTPIAQGGWTFQVPHGSTSVNIINFIYQQPATNPDISADPRFRVNIQCTQVLGTDTFKDLCIQFNDVNKFATDGATTYTLSFQGYSQNGNVTNLGIRILKYFGSGGSTSTDTPFGTGQVSLNTSDSIYNISGTFGTNVNQIVGPNNDDYVQIAIRLPTTAVSNVILSDFVLTVGTVLLTGFPVTTNAQFTDQSTAGWLPVPNPNGSNLYLPIKLGPEGFIYDSSEIGTVVGKATLADFNGTSISTVSNELLCDGSQYQSSGYSSLGVPFQRLATKLAYNGTNGLPIFGTGLNFATAIANAAGTSHLFIGNNQYGTGLAATDSIAAPTGFTFNNIHLDNSATTNLTAYVNSATTGDCVGIITTMSDTGSTGIVFTTTR